MDSFDNIPDEMVTYEKPAGTFAKFTNQGTGEKTYFTANYIYGTWFPNSDFSRGVGDDYEVFDDRYRIGDDTSRVGLLSTYCKNYLKFIL